MGSAADPATPLGRSAAQVNFTLTTMRGSKSLTMAEHGRQDAHDDEHTRGLAIVVTIAGDGDWGIELRCRFMTRI
jgi:hypothetical protein